MENKRQPIYCSCHGDVVMGYRENGQIVWYDQRHGQRHFKALPDNEDRTLYAKSGRPLDNKEGKV